ncbi:MAG: dihydrolipoyl dehydrogenase [Rhodobacteraceae bacterium]|nr:dihydrolipoyl dehydrogenase [Paracoccaceae bacterium]
MSTKTFDMIVIGAGPGGYVAAIRGAQLGLNVAIVEREHMGGICLNWGCIPTKAMLRSAEVLHLMRHAADYGLQAKNVGYDLDAVVKRSRAIAGQLNNGIAHLMKKNKISVFMGQASIPVRGEVCVELKEGRETLTAPHIVIATGARARELPTIQADGKHIWTYKHALQPPHMPKRLLVVGSGAIGIEFASFYHSLGAQTTVVEVLERILPTEDEEIAALAQKAFERQGMTILPATKLAKLEQTQEGVQVQLERNGSTQTQGFDTVILAVGIVGNAENLGLESLGVAIEGTHVITDGYGRTGVEGLYAIGDIAGAPWLAHKASHEGIIVAELIAGGTPHPLRAESIAGCTYCQPQLASVGLSEAAAKEAGYKVRVGRFPFIGNGKAIALGEPEGLIKTVFDAATGALLGAHMIGAEVTEMIQGYVVGRTLETTEQELIDTVFPHPTLSEMMHESVLAAYGRAIHI